MTSSLLRDVEADLSLRGINLRTIRLVAAFITSALVSLSAAAAYIIGDIPRIPMHWNSNWVPTLYAPKLIGLSIIPLLGIIAVASMLLTNFNKEEIRQKREIFIIGALLIAGQILYLYLLSRWLAARTN